jgi:hypothetical protein
MHISLKRVGLPAAHAIQSAQKRIISGELKSPLRTRWPIRILRNDGTEIKTAPVRRTGSGWVITDDAAYVVTFHSMSPSIPKQFVDTLQNHFKNEVDIANKVMELVMDANEVRDLPVSRDHGYPEFVSQSLRQALDEQADLASEDDYLIEEGRVVITATFSYKVAELLRKIHLVDYRTRIVVVGASHRVRGIEEAEKTLHALAVYANGRVLYCLAREIPVDIKDLIRHSVKVHALANEFARNERAQRIMRRQCRASVATHSPSEEESQGIELKSE